MALKIIQLTNKIEIAKRTLAEMTEKDKAFETRAAEIETAINAAGDMAAMEAVDADIENYENELKEHNERKRSLRREIESMESELNALDEPIDETRTDPVVETRKENRSMDINEIRSSKEYLHAWAEAVKTGKDDEVRAILKTENASGTVPVPTYVESKIMTAWDKDDIMRRVRKTYFKGNFAVPYEVSSTPAAVHTEGTAAPDSETLVLGKVVLQPTTIKKWVPVTDERIAMGLGGDEAFIDFIFDELTKHIVEFFDSAVITNIAASSLTRTGTGGSVAEAVIVGESLLSDNASSPVLIMNRSTWAAARIEALSAHYGFDVFDGMEVIKNSNVPDNKIIVGDLGSGYTANFPNGAVVDVVSDADPKSDSVDYVGRLLVGHNVTAPGAFAYITISNE